MAIARRVSSIDLTPWFTGGAGRVEVARRVDEALRDTGTMLVTGHGVPDELRAAVRTVAGRFFALPEEVKARYRVAVGGRGWVPPGAEANSRADDRPPGTPAPPDLKETYSVGAETPTGDPAVDDIWFPPNVWPDEVPEMRRVIGEYLDRVHTLSRVLMRVCAVALALPEDYFEPFLRRPTYTLNLNRYPPHRHLAPVPGQFRIGPHTDFGTLTVLDRQPGLGGLQLHLDGRWVDAPFDRAALTVQLGDLLSRWTGDRWPAPRHRVLPPPADAPDEELLSLIFFYEADHDAVVESLPPPIGTRRYPPVVWGDYLRAKLATISVDPGG